MTPFFEAATDYAQSRRMTIVMRRSEEGEWWAIVVLKDGYGRFEAPVHYMEPKKGRKATKAKAEEMPETADDFAKRVAQEIDKAVVQARKSRIGISFSRAEEASHAVAA